MMTHSIDWLLAELRRRQMVKARTIAAILRSDWCWRRRCLCCQASKRAGGDSR